MNYESVPPSKFTILYYIILILYYNSGHNSYNQWYNSYSIMWFCELNTDQRRPHISVFVSCHHESPHAPVGCKKQEHHQGQRFLFSVGIIGRVWKKSFTRVIFIAHSKGVQVSAEVTQNSICGFSGFPLLSYIITRIIAKAPFSEIFYCSSMSEKTEPWRRNLEGMLNDNAFETW